MREYFNHGDYRLSNCEVLSADPATPEDLAEDPEHPWPDGFVLFRCIVNYPNGKIDYVSLQVANKAVLETQEFWRDFWEEVMERDPDAGEDHQNGGEKTP